MIKLNCESKFNQKILDKFFYYIPNVNEWSSELNIVKGKIIKLDDTINNIYFMMYDENDIITNARYQLFWRDKIFYSTYEKAKEHYLIEVNKKRLMLIDSYHHHINEVKNNIETLLKLMK